MIAEFKPAGRVGLLLTAAIVVALCCLTFTRAAERRPAPRPSAPTAQQTASNAESGQAFEASRIAALEAMRRKFDQLEMRVGKAQDRVDQLRKKFTTLDGRVIDVLITIARSDSSSEPGMNLVGLIDISERDRARYRQFSRQRLKRTMAHRHELPRTHPAPAPKSKSQ